MSDDIQKNEDIKGGQIAQTVQGNQIQINNYSKKTFKSILNYNKEIKIKEQLTTKQERKVIFRTLLGSVQYSVSSSDKS